MGKITTAELLPKNPKTRPVSKAPGSASWPQSHRAEGTGGWDVVGESEAHRV